MSTDRYAWAHSNIEEVAEGVFRIPLPMPEGDRLRAVNVYVIVGNERVTLVDSGWAIPTSRSALVDGLNHIAKSLEDIRQFLVTHLHADHYSQASVLREEFGMPISLGEEEQLNLEQILQNIANGGNPQGGGNSQGRNARLLRGGADELIGRLPGSRGPEPELALRWQPPDDWLPDGVEIDAEGRKLAVVATPGHTRGHVVFHDEQAKLLFSGDHILPQITPSIGLEAARSPWPLRDFITSLKLMKTRPDAKLLPAHGPVWESAHLRVDQLLAHHEARLDDALRVVRSGASTGYDVAKALHWTYHELPLDELDLVNQTMAIGETMAHLDVLMLYGSLSSKTDGEGVERFSTD